MKKGNIIIILILIIIAIFVIFTYPKLVGFVVSGDGGLDYKVQGTLKLGEVEKGTDSCEQSRTRPETKNRLKEWYCVKNSKTNWNVKYYECDECKEGRCMEGEQKIIEETIQEEPSFSPPEPTNDITETAPKLNIFKRIINWFK